jgi:DNA-binding transcriptional LysR family regulator
MPKPTAFNCASTRWAVGSSCATKWLMPRLNGFYARHPGVLVHVHSRVRRFDLTQAGIDAVIGVGYDDWPGMVTHPLMDETVVPVISPQLLRAQPVAQAADLSRHLLLHVAQRPGIWRQWFWRQGVPTQAMRSGPSLS